MAYSNEPLRGLEDFIPKGSFEKVLPYLKKYGIQLTVTKQRKSILGNYKVDMRDKVNRISVNGNLNEYSFLITLIHEIAHCICFNNYGARAIPHGKEWQNIYTTLLDEFVQENIFPDNLLPALHKHILAPKASCSDIELEKALDIYDEQQDGSVYLDSIPFESYFIAQNDKWYKVKEKRRTRYLCEEKETGRLFLFSAHYKVIPIKKFDE
jgi:SprT protein